ncbi:Homeobox-like domain superfamily [Arabidopsis suecica]|uniref:Homeobox-like domain superfamily n=1 Tax=Arabidopsis suecica TaxID=45249 RepID=A0A8T2H230_ARASU|nr:Homeobox-like domain superfamily [Arabidopsis suecica]
MVPLMGGENNLMEETAVVEEDSYDDEFACGDPQVEPRVGDEFQVEIPPMMSASKRAVFLSTPVALDDSSNSFLVGLPVQVMWIDKHRRGQGNGDDNVDMNQSLKSLRAQKSRCSAKIRGNSDKNSAPKKQRLNLEAVPAIPSSSWEDLEVASFVLGLYTFGKNFTQVKNFMENKGIGEVMLFYYGKFHNSAKYHSWSESRKKRNRKCVYGRKIYSGWRQQQLLTRLMPSIPEEPQKQMLVDVSKSFAECNITLEKYVNAVKNLVGLRLLVDAVAIGKEKEDLTVPTSTPMKTKPWFTVSSKPSSVPGVGDYNSLTSAGIINQLTGCSRLSKARCNDIFWDAIWPRLLARGWRSQQPEDRGYFKSKDYIVFIVPGVKKFSRQKLVKGEHYFDSVSDILTKVVSEPELLEYETGGEIREVATNEFVAAENSSDQSDEDSSPSDSQRHRYLKSPCSNRGTLGMKFTVVDTSLAAGGKLCDLRNLNAESLVVSEPKARLGAKDSSALKNSLDSQNVEKSQVRPLDAKNQVDDPMRFTIIDTSVDHCKKSSGFRRWRYLPSDDTKRGYVGADSGIKEEKNLEKAKDPSKRVIKPRSTPRAETNYHSVNSAPYLKRRRLSACISRESPVVKHLPGADDTKRTVCLESEQQSICAVQHQNITCEEMNLEKETVLSVEHMNLKSDQSKKTGTGPSSSLVEIQETTGIEPSGLNSISGVDKNCSPGKIRAAHELISAEQKTNGLCSVSESDKKRASSNDLEQKQAVELPSVSGSNTNGSPSSDLGTTQEVGSSKEQHDQQGNTDGPRRQSTRKRPLTTRALEALESDFLTTKRMKSTTKPEPRKRESSTKKKRSAKACNRNGSADLEHRREDRSSFIKKAPTSKPLDQIEDLKPSYLLNEARTESMALDRIQESRPVLTEYRKLPPIVLKLPFRRG